MSCKVVLCSRFLSGHVVHFAFNLHGFDLVSNLTTAPRITSSNLADAQQVGGAVNPHVIADPEYPRALHILSLMAAQRL